MAELECFLQILMKKLNDNAYPENGPFGRSELANYIGDSLSETQRVIEEELRWRRECGTS